MWDAILVYRAAVKAMTSGAFGGARHRQNSYRSLRQLDTLMSANPGRCDNKALFAQNTLLVKER